MTTLLEHLQASYAEAFPVEHDATPFELWSAGYHTGLQDGQTIKGTTDEIRTEQERALNWDLGYAQGVAYAAFIASHASTVDVSQMDPVKAAVTMRESITAAISLAAENAKNRAQV